MVSKRLLHAIAVVLLGAVASFSVDGIAVSSSYRFLYGDWYKSWATRSVPECLLGGEEGYLRGKINKFTIENSRVVRCDTLTDIIAEFPTLSPDGQQVAFFNHGWKIVNGVFEGAETAQAYVSVMNIDGSNVRNLVSIPRPNKWAKMDWPLGGWLYFDMPQLTGVVPSGEIWRVNVADSSQKERVFDYTTTGEFRRFSLSLAGNRSVAHIAGTPSAAGLDKMPTCFPPIGNFCTAISAAGICNHAMSASGEYIATFYSGSHQDLYFSRWDHVSNALESRKWDVTFTEWTETTGKSITTHGGAEWPRFSVNSDKWVTQVLGYMGNGFGIQKQSSNLLICNWIDKSAILASTNPEAAQNTLLNGNGPGDFWVSGIPEGFYEDTNGVQHRADYTTGIAPQRSQFVPGKSSGLAIVRHGIQLLVTAGGVRIERYQVFAPSGKLLLSSMRGGTCVAIPAATGWSTVIVKMYLANNTSISGVKCVK